MIDEKTSQLLALGMQRRNLQRMIDECDEQALSLMKSMKPRHSLRDLGTAYGISYRTVKNWVEYGLPNPRRKTASNAS